MAIRIAVASSDGKFIDSHFNHAELFYIYDQTNDGFSFVETRNTTGLFEHDEGKFEIIAELLHDCSGIFVSKIGVGAARFLLQKNLRVFEAPYSIDDVLKKLATNNLLQL